MRESLLYHKECLVYPGQYIPLPEIEALWLDLVESGNKSEVSGKVLPKKLKNTCTPVQ